jgi:ubiquinone/menaquinone biosynthesis C-methylase UbiE
LIDFLKTVVPPAPDRPQMAGPEHPMRKVTRQVAFEPGGWTPERAEKVAQLFDTMAPQWSERTSQERQDVLRDALRRGSLRHLRHLREDAECGGLCVEIGSGTGSSTDDLAKSFERVVALDLSRQMLRHAPDGPGMKVQADAFRLPVADGTADAIVLVNALLFPDEMARVLAPSGTLVWVNSLGDRTPIHLTAEEVEQALPGEWDGVAAEAGWGTWTTLSRRDRS